MRLAGPTDIQADRHTYGHAVGFTIGLHFAGYRHAKCNNAAKQKGGTSVG